MESCAQDVPAYPHNSITQACAHAIHEARHLGAAVWVTSHDTAVTRVPKLRVKIYSREISQKTMFCFLLNLCQLMTRRWRCSRKL